MTLASQWRSASQPALDYGTGGEQIARAAFLLIAANIQEKSALVDNLWVSRDHDFATMSKLPYRRTITNVPKLTSIYLGAQPSLVLGPGARFDKWPAITVRSDLRKPDVDQPDHFDTMIIMLIVEVLAAAGPFKVDPVDDRSTSDEIDRQYQRLTDATIACVNQDRSLGGNALPISLPPIVTPSLPQVKKLNSGAGPYCLYQGAELLWDVSTQTRVPGL